MLFAFGEQLHALQVYPTTSQYPPLQLGAVLVLHCESLH